MFTYESMINSNLTTLSNGKMLETAGMLYFNATADGKQVYVDKSNPVFIEIPSNGPLKEGMKVYKGIRNALGNMNWIEPREPEKYLINVDLDELDFYPEGFEREVAACIPFRSYNEVSNTLLDSLYFSLEISGRLKSNIENPPLSMQVPSPVPYTDAGDTENNQYHDNGQHHSGDYGHGEVEKSCGIDPAIIKVIKTARYQHTLIATREFEQRLQVIFKTCRNDILELYINNLELNMWELDSMAASMLDNSVYGVRFREFSHQYLTKVKDAGVYAKLIAGYYKTQLQKVKQELSELRKKINQQAETENKLAEKTEAEYKALSVKRENYRMLKYGFTQTETGWINIDRGTEPKQWAPQNFNLFVQNTEAFDQINTYLIYTSIQSLCRLYSSNNKLFVANEKDKELLMPKNAMAVAVCVAYKGDDLFLEVKEFQSGVENDLKMVLKRATMAELTKITSTYNSYKTENKISSDIAYMHAFMREKKRKEQLRKEGEMMSKLRNIAFPCCAFETSVAETLFINNCSPCHFPDNERLVGPGLAGATKRYSRQWLNSWTRDAVSLIKSGDKQAMKVYKDYNEALQTSFTHLSDEQIESIYAYIDDFNNN